MVHHDFVRAVLTVSQRGVGQSLRGQDDVRGKVHLEAPPPSDGQGLDRGIGRRTQDVGHATDRAVTAIAPVSDGRDDHVAVLRFARFPVGHQQIPTEPRVEGNDEPHLTGLLVGPGEDRRARVQDLHDFTDGGFPRRVTRDLHGDPVSRQSAGEGFRRHEDLATTPLQPNESVTAPGDCEQAGAPTGRRGEGNAPATSPDQFARLRQRLDLSPETGVRRPADPPNGGPTLSSWPDRLFSGPRRSVPNPTRPAPGHPTGSGRAPSPCPARRGVRLLYRLATYEPTGMLASMRKRESDTAWTRAVMKPSRALTR